MINEKSIDTVNQAKFSKKFCRPLYQSYSFLQIPNAIESLLTDLEIKSFPSDVFGKELQHYEKVIFIFLDGFGWNFFEKYRSRIPYLSQLEETATISKITSLFPSTTAAHVTCINTGLDPSQSGIYEWFIYEPSLNEIIAPLPYSIAGDHKMGSLAETSLKPEQIFPKETIHQRLWERGVKSFAFTPNKIAGSHYSNAVLAGSEILGYSNLQDGLNQLLELQKKEKGYFFFYHGEIDSIGHRKGIYSPEFSQSIEEALNCVGTFDQKLDRGTALIISADHGMTEVDPKTTFYLNKKIPNIEKKFLQNARLKPLVPAGSCRDLFLHLREESLNETKEILEHFLEGIAEVHYTVDLIKEGLFGAHPPSMNFINRVGNLVVLPFQGESVWWYEKGRFVQNFYGAHGGLTPDEMHIPLIFKSK